MKLLFWCAVDVLCNQKCDLGYIIVLCYLGMRWIYVIFLCIMDALARIRRLTMHISHSSSKLLEVSIFCTPQAIFWDWEETKIRFSNFLCNSAWSVFGDWWIKLTLHGSQWGIAKEETLHTSKRNKENYVNHVATVQTLNARQKNTVWLQML